MIRSKWLVLLCLVALVGFLGCPGGGSDLGTVPVSGKVTLDGQPVDGASVAFSPTGDGKAAVGLTDATGAFTLMTDGIAEGAQPGSYGVTVTKTAGGEGGGPPLTYDQMTPEQLEEAAKTAEAMMEGGDQTKTEELLPEKYKSTETSGLTVEVPPDGTDSITLELVSE